MTVSNKVARKLYWATMTPAKRSEHARMMVKARYAKMSKEQLSEHAKKLAQIRWGKKLSTETI